MKKYLLPNDVNWYRANFHCHTVHSDGAYTPEKVKEVYKNHGYSIVAYTDHDVLLDHSDLNDDEFLALTSSEYAVNEAKPKFPKIFDISQSPVFFVRWVTFCLVWFLIRYLEFNSFPWHLINCDLTQVTSLFYFTFSMFVSDKTQWYNVRY